jgi:hypothetical protein
LTPARIGLNIWGTGKIMGSLLVVSIAAMTSVMTMIQLVVLALTLPVSPAPKAGESSPAAGLVAVQGGKKAGEKAIVSRAAVKHRRRHRARRAHVHNAPNKG